MFIRAYSRLWKMSSKHSCGVMLSTSKLRGCSGENRTAYETAIETLNALQVPLRDQPGHIPWTFEDKFAEIRNLPVEELRSLAAIHVAGTKGKGSVCAFSESILRSSGYKTGLYSSPHILEVRERMRINGRSISKSLFTHYFWECWENFEEEKKRFYQTFLVFMAFHVFLKEKVDVAVVEVGCGGEYDPTNVLRHPMVCGVTLLDKDHWKSLGGSVESIAWHKSGIFKPGVPAFTVPQDPLSIKVLEERAKERQTSLKIVPEFLTYPDSSSLVLGIEGKHQLYNASLAVQLCQTWIERRSNGRIAESEEVCSSESLAHACVFSLPESFKEGLAKTFWPGRSQCVERENITFYIDGAHTRKSIEACVQWFSEKSEDERLRKSLNSVAQVLIFNLKGDRDARSLMQPLVKCNFDYVLFCPNILNNEPLSRSSDTSNFYQVPEEVRQKCFANEKIWREVLQTNSCPVSESRVFPCVSDTFNWLIPPSNALSIHDVIDASHLQVFVTGSLYLVSMVLRILDEEIEHI